MAHAALDATFQELTEPRLIRLLRSEIGDPLYLDGFVRDKTSDRLSRAMGPKAILHVFSSNIPNASIWSVVMGLLVKSHNILKTSQHDAGVLEIYLESLKKSATYLHKRTQLISSRHSAVKSYLRSAQVIICYGDDETIARLHSQADPNALFVGYGHRVSFTVVLKEILTEKNSPLLAKKLAVDSWMVDGRGCLSPAAIYVQSGGEVSPQKLEKLYRAELSYLYQDGTADYKTRTQHMISSLKVQVHEFKNNESVIKALRPNAPYLQAVALEATPKNRLQTTKQLSDLGFNRICRAGQMQYPPITWHHDGRSNIASWLTWTDLA
jgi:hypothetical protein